MLATARCIGLCAASLVAAASVRAEPGPPPCRFDNTFASTVSATLKAAGDSYVAMGRPRMFDGITVNPATPVTDARVLSVYIVTDASKDLTTSSGCARAPARKDEPLDDLSVRGGCVVVGIERMQIRCSADAVRLFGEVRQRPGRAHPALLYVLAHEVAHLLQKRAGAYSGRVDRIDLKSPSPAKLQALRDACDPVSTRHEDEADAMAVQVLTRLLPQPPYREPLFSAQGSAYWSVDQMYLAANAWQQSALEREFISRPKVHRAFVPAELPSAPAVVERNAAHFVCDVLTKRRGVVAYPSRSATHPPLEQRLRRIAEALRPIAASLPTTGGSEQFRSIAVLQEQLGPVFNHLYRETGIYMEALQAAICTRANSEAPDRGCQSR